MGRIASACDSAGVAYDYADLCQTGAAPPSLDGYHGLVILGGPMSANDVHPWVAIEIALIHDAIRRDLPVLGVCLGSQLIAKALGADVSKNPRKEIGWFDLHFTPDAARDPLFAEFADRETVFHWHSETFAMPPGSLLLASSQRCRNQAFRYGQKIYGLQFHLEVTPEMIDWMQKDENCGDVRGLEAPIDPVRNCERIGQLSQKFFGRWLGLLLTPVDPKSKNP